MKKSLFTMALVAAGAVIYLLSKDKEEEKSETPEIRLIDLKKDNNEEENHEESHEEPLETVNEAVEEKEEKTKEPEVEAAPIEQPEKIEPEQDFEEHISDLMNEIQEEIQVEPVEEVEEPIEVKNEEEPEAVVVDEEIHSEPIKEEPVLEDFNEEETEDTSSEETILNEESLEESTNSNNEEVVEENVNSEENAVEENTDIHDEAPVEETKVPKEIQEDTSEEENSDEEEPLNSKILNEIEQESIGFNSTFTPKEEEASYSGTVYEVSELYPYLSYEMIDKILDANVGFSHVYQDNQPIKIVHRVGFDKIEDLIEFVILIKEHDYRVEENNGLDMISISKEMVVEDMIIMSDIFNVSNQVYRLHGHYQGYEIVEL